MDELVAIEFDLAMASLEAIDLFLDQAEDDNFYMDIFNECRTRPDALKLIMDHEKTPEAVREAGRQCPRARSPAAARPSRTQAAGLGGGEAPESC